MRCCHLLQYFVTRSFNESYLQIRYHLQGGQKVRQIYLIAHIFERARLIVLAYIRIVLLRTHSSNCFHRATQRSATWRKRNNQFLSFFFLLRGGACPFMYQCGGLTHGLAQCTASWVDKCSVARHHQASLTGVFSVDAARPVSFLVMAFASPLACNLGGRLMQVV